MLRRPLAFVLLAAAVVVPSGPAVALGEEPLCDVARGRGARTVRHPLRIATFNLLHGQGDVGHDTLEARLPLQVDVLARAGVDVVGAQEVAKMTSSGLVAERLARGLAARTGRTWHWCWFASNPHFPLEPDLEPGGGGGPFTEAMAGFARAGEDEFREGLAILSRFPILDAAVHRVLPRSYEAAFCVPPDPLDCNAAAFFDARSVLWARLKVPGGPVDVFTTHVAHGLTPLSDTTKLLQTQQVLDWIDQVAVEDRTPDFLVGDFNSEEGSPVQEEIAGAGFVDTFRRANRSAPGLTSGQDVLAARSTVDSRIDYVFARPGSCGLAVSKSAVIANRAYRVKGKPLWPSDHYGVASTVACGRAA